MAGLGHAFIGVGEGISRGIRDVGAIQGIVENRERLEREKAEAPLRLDVLRAQKTAAENQNTLFPIEKSLRETQLTGAQQQSELGAIALDKAKRQAQMDALPYDPKQDIFFMNAPKELQDKWVSAINAKGVKTNGDVAPLRMEFFAMLPEAQKVFKDTVQLTAENKTKALADKYHKLEASGAPQEELDQVFAEFQAARDQVVAVGTMADDFIKKAQIKKELSKPEYQALFKDVPGLRQTFQLAQSVDKPEAMVEVMSAILKEQAKGADARTWIAAPFPGANGNLIVIDTRTGLPRDTGIKMGQKPGEGLNPSEAKALDDLKWNVLYDGKKKRDKPDMGSFDLLKKAAANHGMTAELIESVEPGFFSDTKTWDVRLTENAAAPVQGATAPPAQPPIENTGNFQLPAGTSMNDILKQQVPGAKLGDRQDISYPRNGKEVTETYMLTDKGWILAPPAEAPKAKEKPAEPPKETASIPGKQAAGIGGVIENALSAPELTEEQKVEIARTRGANAIRGVIATGKKVLEAGRRRGEQLKAEQKSKKKRKKRPE